MNNVLRAIITSILIAIVIYIILAFVYCSFNICTYDITTKGMAGIAWGLLTFYSYLCFENKY